MLNWIGLICGLLIDLGILFADGGAYQRSLEKFIFHLYGYSYPYGMDGDMPMELVFVISVMLIWATVVVSLFLIGRHLDKYLAFD